MKVLSFFIFILFFLLTLSATGFSAQVTLAWNPNTEPNLAGYTIYYGTSSGNYSSSISLGNVTTSTINNLSGGVAYFFVLTARNTVGLESGYSNEVNYTPAVSQFTLTVSKTGTGSGTVTNSPSGTTFTAGTLVSLTAAANANSVFTGWSGACSGTTNPCTATMNANTAVTAAFALKTYTITASAGSGGSISPSGGINANQGASQNFTVTPTTGYQIASVTVDGVSQVAISSYTFTNVTAAHTIGATFSKNVTTATHGLSVYKKGSGRGSIVKNPSGTVFNSGTEVILTAAPYANSVFFGWSGACIGNSPVCTVTINADTSVTATFNLKGAIIYDNKIYLPLIIK